MVVVEYFVFGVDGVEEVGDDVVHALGVADFGVVVGIGPEDVGELLLVLGR